MKKVTLFFISSIMLFSLYQSNAGMYPEKIVFTIHNSESRYPVSKDEDDFVAAFLYLQFMEELEVIKFDREYAQEHEACLGIKIEELVEAMDKIKTVLEYGDQIELLREEIIDAVENDEIDINGLNKIIQQFHPVKALQFKRKIIRGILGIPSLACRFVCNLGSCLKRKKVSE